MDAIDEEFLPPSINRTETLMADNSSMTDFDLTMDGSVVGEYDNFSYLYCAVNNFTYINVTCEPTFEYSLVLLGFIAPFFIIITLIANTAIVIVLSRKNMQTPTNAVLLGMAVCDMLTILFAAPGLMYMYTLRNHDRPLGPLTICYFYHFFKETVPSLFHTASIWLTVALAFQRYIYVCHAPLARIFLTLEKVRRGIVYIVLAAVVHQSTRFCDVVFIPLDIVWGGEEFTVCHQKQADWVEYIGEDLYYTAYYMFRVIFVHLLPCTFLIVLNILLFRTMRVAQQKRQKLFDKCCKKSKRANDKNCTTLMLIIVVSVFLIVEVPLAIITGLHVFSSLFFITFLDYRIANNCIIFANFFIILSYPVNFALYCGMSRQFRETFREIFFKRSLSANGNNVTTIMGGSRKHHDMSSRYSLVNINGPRSNTTNETVL